MEEILKKNIISELGIDTLPDEKQEEMLLDMSRIIFQAVLLRVMEELEEKDLDAFEKLLAEKPEEEVILNFLRGKVPNLDEIITEEVARFKEESAGIMSRVIQ